MAGELIPIMWGTHRLWCALVSTTNNRALVIHRLSSGDVSPVRDSGLDPRITSLDLLFDDFPGEDRTPVQRFKALLDSHERGDELMFSHPLRGSYRAKIGEFTYDLESDGLTPRNVRVQFVPTGNIEPIRPAGAGVAGITGEGSVVQSAADLQTFLDEFIDFGESDAGATLPDDAVAMQSAWTQSETVPTRQVFLDVADVSDRLGELIDGHGLEEDLALFTTYRAAILFGAAFRNAGIAATSDTPAIFILRVTSPTSLLALMARVYGGLEAPDRLRQVMELNDIRTPGWFGPGDLLAPAKSRGRIF